jgi:hypothetical protein
MKKNHSPGGAPVYCRVLLYSIAFIALIGTRETLSGKSGPVSDRLGSAFNRVLLVSSKMGLGFALMNHQADDQSSMLARCNRSLGTASHRAFVSAAKVDLFAR